MKKTGLNRYIYDFSVNYDAIAVDDILDIHSYLIKKNEIVQENAWFYEKVLFTGLAFLPILTGINSLSCISMNNQECRMRPQIVNVTGDEPVFFPFSIKTSKCSGSCNNL